MPKKHLNNKLSEQEGSRCLPTQEMLIVSSIDSKIAALEG